MLNNPRFIEMLAGPMVEVTRKLAVEQLAADDSLAERQLELVDGDGIESTIALGIERRPLAGGPALNVEMVTYRKGTVVALHSHAAAQAGYVVEGCLRITTPDDQLRVGAGDCYVIPPGVPHQIRAAEPTSALDFYAPGPGVAEAALPVTSRDRFSRQPATCRARVTRTRPRRREVNGDAA